MQTEEKKRKNTRKKNPEIIGITVGFTALFLVMMGYLVFYSVSHKEELFNNSYNNRQQIVNAQNRRGSIYAAGGEILAQTVVDEEGKEQRVYPYDNLFAHAVGYTGKGKSGVEEQMNYDLVQSGIPATEKVRNELIGEKNPGDNVYTTLDVTVQEAASKAMGIYKGAIIAIEPSTGRIVAMVSKPDFDPNKIATLWDDLIADEESGTLLNRTTQGLYPPGSTFKIVTTLEYIRENPDTYQNYSYNCTGHFEYEGDRINCYHGSKHGKVDLKKSFAKSCNSSFANIGIGLDRTKFVRTMDSLLFNKELPLDCKYNQSKIVLDEDTAPDQMMQNAIGQGKTQITPIQLAMITATIANNGELMKPYMIDRVETVSGNKVKHFSPAKYGRLMTEEEAAILKEYMEEVVESGTGTKLSGLSYTAAGKTGSAEFGLNKLESHAWFTGFAPVEDPRLVVTVIIEGAGSGGDYAVPMAKRVFDAYFS